jgi:ribonuclease HI
MKHGMKQTILFTDGSSRGNPGPGGWAAILIENDSVHELGGFESDTTNNRMELQAAIQGLRAVSGPELTIYTDSAYLIKGSTEWMRGWKRNGWITSTKEEVLNRDLWEDISDALEGKKVTWLRVSGHSGVSGNERCDVIATAYADEKDADLYSGPLSEYPISNILDISENASAASKKSGNKKSSSAPAYSYVSKVDGKIETHSSWKECEARVKGKSGARFKKAFTATDEAAIIESFK